MGEMPRDLDEELRDALRALPLLALPGTVFFANTFLPIHVCDERYVDLLDEVLRDSRWLGVVLWPTGNKNPERIGQLAKVVQHTKAANGRYDLVLQGMGRMQLEELGTRSSTMLRSRCRLLDSHLEDGEQIATELQAFHACYQRFLELCPEQPDLLAELCSGVQEPDMLADVICAALLEDMHLRQHALEERSCIRRLQLVSDSLSKLVLKKLDDTGPIH